MRRETLALALALAISGCFEVGQGVRPEASPEPSPEPTPEASPVSPTPDLAPRPRLPFVKRHLGVDRLFLFDPRFQEVVEIPEAVTGGPILNPSYFERRGEARILYNSGGTLECPEGSGFQVADRESFGAYVLDLGRRLRVRLSEEDFFFSVVTGDGSLFAHLDVSDFPPPQDVSLILGGLEPFHEEVILAALGLEPGLLADISIAAMGGWVAGVKGPVRAASCRFPPEVDGRLYLYDLTGFRLYRLSELFGLPPVQAAALSPSGRQVVMLSEGQVLRLDRVSGLIDAMPLLNQSHMGQFRRVRFLAGVEEVFYLEVCPPGGRTRLMAYDWQAQVLNALPMVNLVEEAAELYLSPPY